MANTNLKPGSRENVEKINLTVEQIIAKQDDAAARHKSEMQEIENQRLAMYAVLTPFHGMVATHNALSERISVANAQRTLQASFVEDFNNEIEKVIGNPNSAGRPYLNFQTYFDLHPNLAVAERGIVLIDRWLEVKKADLAEVEKSMREYAHEHSLEYMLPDELKTASA
jgi:hypothetical protein